MAYQFRKSLFGFNSDDVTEYISKTHKEYSEKVTVLNEKIENLNDELTVANTNVKTLAASNAELEAKLKFYTDKYEEIERLAQSIGKLYIVANANAKAIMESAQNNRNIAKLQVDDNLKGVEDIQTALIKTRENITKTASEFSDRLQSLLNTLSVAKDSIKKNDIKSNEKISEFEALINSIN